MTTEPRLESRKAGTFRWHRTALALCLLAFATQAADAARPRDGDKTRPRPRRPKAVDIALDPIATQLTQPVDLAEPGDGTPRLFIVEQRGTIRVWDGERLLANAFLDIRPLVSCTGGNFCDERGLLGLAFHPDYESNGFFYVNYTDTAGDTQVVRYEVSADPNRANAGSAATILSISQPFDNHNGGGLKFGPDGYLYIGSGDGGSGGDPMNNAQDLGTLLGKLLRIDVDAQFPYAVPPDNPFVETAGARPEIWALGLRNPWRFSFDRQQGDLFIADVGQSQWEEVNYQPAATRGQNYGWRRMEGKHCFNPPSDCNDGSLVLPVLEYDHDEGCSITGGHVYRGLLNPSLRGRYIFGDYCSGTLWQASRNAAEWTRSELLDTGLRVSTFGEDRDGELYVASHGTAAGGDGAVYKIRQVVGACAPGTLCLQDGRFQLAVDWHNQYDGSGGAGHGVPSTDLAGFFWFDDARNLELVVKIIDFGDVYKLFLGQLTDLQFEMKVTDLHSGQVKVYHNGPNNCGLLDQAAFPKVEASGNCVPASDRLCLLDNRFAATVDWSNHHNQTSGVGKAQPLTDFSGLFVFDDTRNIELVVKTLDFGDRILVLIGSLSDFGFNLHIDDTVTGARRQYINSPGEYCGLIDPNAF